MLSKPGLASLWTINYVQGLVLYLNWWQLNYPKENGVYFLFNTQWGSIYPQSDRFPMSPIFVPRIIYYLCFLTRVLEGDMHGAVSREKFNDGQYTYWATNWAAGPGPHRGRHGKVCSSQEQVDVTGPWEINHPEESFLIRCNSSGKMSSVNEKTEFHRPEKVTQIHGEGEGRSRGCWTSRSGWNTVLSVLKAGLLSGNI